MLAQLRQTANFTRTENGGAAYAGTGSACLDLFAAAGALRGADEAEIVTRFLRAYAEDADLAVKALFFARDVRGGLGERRFFRIVLRWMAAHEPASVRRNIPYVAEYGRFDDLLVLMGTPCEKDALAFIRAQLLADMEALEAPGEKGAAVARGAQVSLLAKWLPSANASSPETVRLAKRVARGLGMTDAQYRRMLSALRARIRILENALRTRDYTFAYEKQPSGALFKYRQAFWRNDGERYQAFLLAAAKEPSLMHTGTLTPYDIITPVIRAALDHGNWPGSDAADALSEAERRSIDTAWRAQQDFTCGENALVVADGSGSMYWGAGGSAPLPAAVAQSLAIYFAERNTGRFKDHFITFSAQPQLVGVRGRDITEKVRYCMSFNDCSNTDLEKVFDLILEAARSARLPQEEMPSRLYVISDMEFDCCSHADETCFALARDRFAEAGYRLPEVVYWNVQSRHRQQPVTLHESGAVLVSGCSPHIFGLLRDRELDPWHFMLEVLGSERYAPVSA